MTHDEAVGLLPAYALGALVEDVTVLEAHLHDCRRCSALLATYLESTVALGDGGDHFIREAGWISVH